jgi:hypothetical protein
MVAIFRVHAVYILYNIFTKNVLARSSSLLANPMYIFSKGNANYVVNSLSKLKNIYVILKKALRVHVLEFARFNFPSLL